MLLFALNASRRFGEAVARSLGIELAAHEEREFEDGEHKLRSRVDVRGRDCFVIQSLHGDAEQSGDDKLVRLLFFAAALHDHGAARVTAVVPYLAYSRKDRQTQPFDAVMSRYVAMLFEAMRIDALITLEVHNVVALQNAFRIPTLHLSSAELFAPHAAAVVGDRKAVVVSPDPGGVKRAQLFRETLETHCQRSFGAAYLEKRRTGGVTSGSLLAGDVCDAVVLLVDDLISTGGTLLRAAHICRESGANEIHAIAAHGLFTQGASAAMADPLFAGICVSDTVPPFRLAPEARDRVTVVGAAPLFARAIEELAAKR